jgi:hypothetical protein
MPEAHNSRQPFSGGDRCDLILMRTYRTLNALRYLVLDFRAKTE